MAGPLSFDQAGEMLDTFRRFVLSIVVLASALALTQLGATSAMADSSGTDVIVSWGVTGRVNSIVVADGDVFVGGTFTSVVDPSGNTYPISNLALYDPATSSFDTTWHPNPNDNVAGMAVSADGSQLYIGGDFTAVNGLNASHLADIDIASGSVNTGWNVGTTGSVNTVAVNNGQVYVGGVFTQVTDSAGTHTIANAARVDGTTGNLDTAWVPAPNKQVLAFNFSPDGTMVYIGGEFTKLGTNGTRPHLAAVTSIAPATVLATFKPAAYNGTSTPEVFSLVVDGSNLIIGAGGSGGACASEDATTGLLNWTYKANGDVQSVSVDEGTVWCGGHFVGSTSFGGVSRNKIAAVDEASGTLLPYAPSVNSSLGVWAIAASGPGVYLGGDFTTVAFENVSHFAYIEPATYATTPDAPINLVARAGDSSARIFWDVPYNDGGSPLKKYSVFRAKTGGTLKKVASVSTASYSDSTLTNGTTYQYAIESTNALGSSVMTPIVTVTPQAGLVQSPTPPRALSAKESNGQAVLTWNAPADNGGSALTGYVVMRGSTEGSETAIATIDPSLLTWTDPTSGPTNTYYYTLVAQNAIGSSDPSNEYSVTVYSSVPGAPVLSAQVVSNGVSLSWTTPDSGGSAITKYTIVRDSVQIAHINFGTNTYVDTSVTIGGGTTYSYQVRATNSIGNGPLSTAVQVTP